MVEEMKEKDQQLEVWRKQAMKKEVSVTSSEANISEIESNMEKLKEKFEKEKQALIEKHQNDKKRLAIAAREKFRKDFEVKVVPDLLWISIPLEK